MAPDDSTAPPPPTGEGQPETPRLLYLRDLLDEVAQDAAAAYDAKTTGTPRGPLTGLPRLDVDLGGALPPGLTVLHGQPGAGKSAFALQVATECKAPALFVSTEMRPVELLYRLTARITTTYLHRLKSGSMSPAEVVALVRRGIEAAPLLAIADATRAFADPAWLLHAARQVRGESMHLLVVLDSAHTWADMLQDDTPEYERLNATLTALRKLTAELGCATLAIAERNRASMKSGGLNAAASTRKFEYSAEALLALSRDEDAVEDAAGERRITVTIEKNRNGPAGRKLHLRFHGSLQQFRDV